MGSLPPQQRNLFFIFASFTLTSTLCPSLVHLPMCFPCVYIAASTIGEEKEPSRADWFMITTSHRSSVWPSHLSVVNSLFHSSGLYFLSLLSIPASRDSHLFTEKVKLLQLLLPRHKSTRILLCSYHNRAAVLLKSKASSSTCLLDTIFSNLVENLTLSVFSPVLTDVSFLNSLSLASLT